MYTFIDDIFESFDCPFEYAGVSFLREILVAALKNSADISLDCKNLIYDVCQSAGFLRDRIEKNLRTLIVQWYKMDKFKELFPLEIPTNQSLIAKFYRLAFKKLDLKSTVLQYIA
ncbi:MAG: hypothetical protein LBH47_01210 [Christensenellaceae bacterium]|jgi:hypothetical protein|nr:hypothetical protein [Christensenellaceae bacterium]